MGSLYLNGKSKEERAALVRQLWRQQSGKCFISGREMDLEVDELDIDHIIPTRDNGRDDPTNFALTLASYNRSKQASDLRVARVLARFSQIRETADSDDRGANLNDVLRAYGGASGSLRGKIDGHQITYVANGDDKVTVPLYTDKLSSMRYFFAVFDLSPKFHPVGSRVC